MCHIFIESDKVRSPTVAGNVPISLIFQQLMKVIGSRKVKQREKSPRTRQQSLMNIV